MALHLRSVATFKGKNNGDVSFFQLSPPPHVTKDENLIQLYYVKQMLLLSIVDSTMELALGYITQPWQHGGSLSQAFYQFHITHSIVL